MRWTPEKNKELKDLWDINSTDEEIAKYFGTTAIAVAGQRSKINLVHCHRKRKNPLVVQLQAPLKETNKLRKYTLLKYEVNGVPGSARIDAGQDVEKAALSIMDKHGINNVTAYVPAIEYCRPTRLQAQRYE